MRRQRVLLLGRAGLLAQGVGDLLSRQEDIEVLSASAPIEGTSESIVAFGPDVVVVAEDGPANSTLTADALRAFSDLPIVRIDLNEKRVRVYTSQQVAATSADLLGALRGLVGRASSVPPPERSLQNKGGKETQLSECASVQ